MVNGQVLRPAASLKSVHKSAVAQDEDRGQTALDKPDQQELDMLYRSFKPGLTESDRYAIQDASAFYRTRFPKSAYQARLTSYAARVASMDPQNARCATASHSTSKKVSLQATCREMKAEVNRAASMHNYDIKSKHRATM